MSHQLSEVSLDALAAATAPGRLALQLRNAAAKQAGGAGASLRQQAVELEAKAAQQVLDAAQVVAATCVGAGAMEDGLRGCWMGSVLGH